jgi:hypothetical protein
MQSGVEIYETEKFETKKKDKRPSLCLIIHNQVCRKHEKRKKHDRYQ